MSSIQEMQNKLINRLGHLDCRPKLIKEDVVYFEDFSIVLKEGEVFLHFDVDTYPDIVALVCLTIFDTCFAWEWEVKIGPVYSPVYDAFGQATDIVFGEEAKKEYENTTKRYYINQENISNFLKKVDKDSLHQC